MGQYGAVDITTWNDGKFRSLTPPPPCGQVLWLYLLAPRERTIIPGLIPVGVGTIAESLRWPYEATRAAMDEVVAQGMAVEDPAGPLIWLPNALRHNRPRNQHQVTGWGRAWASIPECPLKRRAWVELRQSIGQLGEQFAASFAASFPEPSPCQFRAPSGGTVPPHSPRNRRRVSPRNGPADSRGAHEQEHEQEQEAFAAAARVSDEQRQEPPSPPAPEPAGPPAPPTAAAPESPGPVEPATSVAAQANAASGGESPAARDAGGAAPAGIAGGQGARGPARPAARPPLEDEIPRRPVVLYDTTDLGPLGAEFRGEVQARIARPLAGAKAENREAVSAELEQLLELHGVDPAVGWVVTEILGRKLAKAPEVHSLTGCLLILRDMPVIRDLWAEARAQCPEWARFLEAIRDLPFEERLDPGALERHLLTLSATFRAGELVLGAQDDGHRYVIEQVYLGGLRRQAARLIGQHVVVTLAPAPAGKEA